MLVRAVGVALVGAIALGAAVLGVAAPAQAATVSPQAKESFAQLAACAGTADDVLASIVVDASGSLKDTDPSAARVQAIQVALASLRDLQASSATGLAVRASLATFNGTFTTLVPWGSVSGAHGAQLRDVATSRLPTATDGGTDYRKALAGARDSLDREARARKGEKSCKIMLWFTDGGLDVGTTIGTEQARKEICRQGGLADDVRNDGIAVIALALFQSGAGGVTTIDRDRLRATAEGSGRGAAASCGTLPLAEGAAGGAYLRADDAGSLSRLFAQAAAMISGGSAGTSVRCPGEGCDGGAFDVPFDRAAAGFRAVIGGAGGTGVLTAPSGERIPLSGTSAVQRIGADTVKVTRRADLTTVEVDRAAPATRTETWRLRFDSSKETLLDTYYFWGAKLAVTAPEPLVVGGSGRIRIVLADRFGAGVSGSGLKGLSVDAKIDGRDVALKDLGDGRWQAKVALPSGSASVLPVVVTARALTAPSSSSLGPIVTRVDLPTRLAAAFPSISPSSLDLGSVAGTAAATGSIRFRGSAEGPTRACVRPARLTGPRAAGGFVQKRSATCVDIPAGADREAVVSVAANSSADGRASGTVPVDVTGAHGDTTTVQVPIQMDLVRPVDTSRQVLLTVLLMLIGLIGAIAAAVVARWLGDRYVLSIDARVASVQVAFDRRGVRRRDPSGSAALLDAEHDFEPFGIERRSRRRAFDARGVVFTRRFPLWPLRPAEAVASGDKGEIVLAPRGPREPARDRRADTAQIAFPGSTGFVLLVEPSDVHADPAKELRGRIVLVVDERDGVSAVLPERIREIEQVGWDRVVDRVLAAKAARDEQPARSSPKPADSTVPGRDPAEPPTVSVPVVRGGLMDWTGEVSIPTISRSTPAPRAPRRRTARPPTPTKYSSSPPPPTSSINFLD